MDTSPEYIKMCEKAVKLQEQSPIEQRFHNPMECKDFFHDEWWTEEIPGELVNGKPIYNQRSSHTWLPRQDQLQAMVLKDGIYGARQITKALWEASGALVPRESIGYPAVGTADVKWSMEQLWLAFVMKEKYGKVWNNEDWVAA